MIVGNGDIASVLADDRPGWLWFASGVSNSQETRESEYEREIALMREHSKPGGWHIVYFSTLAVFYSNTRYAEHKQRMEIMVRALYPGAHTIVRLGNITWGKNPHTLINFFKAQMAAGISPVIQDVDRYIVELEEFQHWIKLIPQFSCDMNIPGRRMKVAEVWEKYVGHRAQVDAPDHFDKRRTYAAGGFN